MRKDQLQKYFDQSTSSQEKEDIFSFFEDNPDALNDVLNDEDWNSFVQNKDSSKTKKKRSPKIYFYIIIPLLILGILFSTFFYKAHITNEKKEVYNNGLQNSDDKIENFYTNNSSENRKIQLPDNSIVELKPNSQITLERGYNQKNRFIHLIGTAIFEVHKNPEKPFTVFSKGVATTALGTKFSVEEYQNGIIKVRLLSGKILVKSYKTTLHNREYFLAPGNEITYNTLTHLFSDFTNKKEIIKDESSIASNQKIKISDPLPTDSRPLFNNGAFVGVRFNGTPLSDVLDYLAFKGNLHVQYPPEQISNIKFVGTFNKTDNIEKTLYQIAHMNDLSISKDTIRNLLIIK